MDGLSRGPPQARAGPAGSRRGQARTRRPARGEEPGARRHRDRPRRPRRGPGGRQEADGRHRLGARRTPGSRRSAELMRTARGKRIDRARRVAYEALLATHRDGAYANIVLPQILRDEGVHGRDAAFATEITYGTLRAMGTLDLIIAKAAGRAVDRIDPPARDALRLGAYQLLHTRVPPHAAVAETVELVRQVAPGAVGFANAVLRRVTEHTLDEWIDAVSPAYDEDPIA